MPAPYDFIVVGSGFGGSVSALRLAEKGYSVAVLEAGRRYAPTDFPRTNWNLPRSFWSPSFGCFGILRMTLLRDALVLSGTGLGGGSLVYAATLLEPPDGFYDDPQWSGMADWRAELAPHFASARRMLGVDRNPRMTPADRVLRACAEELGVAGSFRMQDVGIYFGEPGERVTDPYFGGLGPEREGCRFCGGCMVGCRHGAKNSLDLNYLHLAEARGVDVFVETKAVLVREVQGRGYVVKTRRVGAPAPGRKRTFEGRSVVVAAGVLGTLELLLRCRDQGSLPNISRRLGLGVRTNSEAIVGATARRSDGEDYSEGIAISSSVHLDGQTHVEPVRYPRGSDAMALLATLLIEGDSRGARLSRWVGQAVSHPLDFLRSLWPFGWAKRTVILLAMQSREGRFRLVRRRRVWPWPPALDSLSNGEGHAVRSYIPAVHDLARRVAHRIDGFPISSLHEVFLNVPVTAHILGGCTIGPDPDRGVVDAHLHLYGHPGIRVVDGSVVPANPGVNPSLTITALAEHAMAHVPPKGADA